MYLLIIIIFTEIILSLSVLIIVYCWIYQVYLMEFLTKFITYYSFLDNFYIKNICFFFCSYLIF